MSGKKGTDKNLAYDVIIVGGGPAGLFAAYYLSEQSSKNILLIEKGKADGLTYTVLPGQSYPTILSLLGYK